jgi:hypothetical protein
MPDVLFGGSTADVAFTSRIITILFLSVKSWYPRGTGQKGCGCAAWRRNRRTVVRIAALRKGPKRDVLGRRVLEADGGSGQDRGHGVEKRSRERARLLLGFRFGHKQSYETTIRGRVNRIDSMIPFHVQGRVIFNQSQTFRTRKSSFGSPAARSPPAVTPAPCPRYYWRRP